jgi:hypothetical protein
MNDAFEQVETEVLNYVAEAKELLPGLPADLSFVWDSGLTIPGNGTGGTLVRPTVLGIGYDPDFEDKQKLSKHLRATVLHECVHALQGWSDQEPTTIPKNLLEYGVLEGVATVFEREFGHTSPPWGLYEDEKTMRRWLEEIKSLRLAPNSDEYIEYKFGKVGGVNWMLYKLGTWIADRALKNNPQLSIVDLASKKPEDIIELALA